MGVARRLAVEERLAAELAALPPLGSVAPIFPFLPPLGSVCQSCSTSVIGKGMLGVEAAEKDHLAASPACAKWGSGRPHPDWFKRFIP